ncbi:NUDIX domain-containing protein [Candidatus Saccharibacteria bacterium]|jgi:8-oxo-dGTP diphosphatase|nr:NUDIX domain-containing protein [Candidatus Saccharibacteria bacterium]
MNLQVGVKALIQNENGQYLFMRRSERMGSEAAPHLDIPGGRIDPSEPLEAALKREINEETGLELQSIDALLAAQDIFVPSKELHVVRLTYAVKASGTVQLSSEHVEYVWASFDEAAAIGMDSYIKEVAESVASA